MPTELELKFRLPDAAAMRQRLADLGAAQRGHVLEVNRLFDTADGQLRQRDCGLRIRTVTPLDRGVSAARPPARLTFKGPRDAGPLKSREELETDAGDPDTLMALLARLGYHEVVHFEKRRTTYTLADCEITLDELPRLGSFLEIEGDAPARIETIRADLGLADTAPLHETYVDLAAQHGDRDARGCVELRFDT